MSVLTIREIPDELDNFLQRSAAKNRRSKEKEALFLLEEIAGVAAVDWSDFLARPRRRITGDV
ncbi:MAG: hypothetical protein ABUL66_01650, partial [Verrucomicrobiota bacterium]